MSYDIYRADQGHMGRILISPPLSTNSTCDPPESPILQAYLSVIPHTLKYTSKYLPSRWKRTMSNSMGCRSTVTICIHPWKAVWLERQPVRDAGLGQPRKHKWQHPRLHEQNRGKMQGEQFVMKPTTKKVLERNWCHPPESQTDPWLINMLV